MGWFWQFVDLKALARRAWRSVMSRLGLQLRRQSAAPVIERVEPLGGERAILTVHNHGAPGTFWARCRLLKRRGVESHARLPYRGSWLPEGAREVQIKSPDFGQLHLATVPRHSQIAQRSVLSMVLPAGGQDEPGEKVYWLQFEQEPPVLHLFVEIASDPPLLGDPWRAVYELAVTDIGAKGSILYKVDIKQISDDDA